MDGTATMSEIRQTFSTPIRILLPKLLKSREDWKAKSHERKAQLKSAKIKIRDLSASRDKWRERTEQLQEQNEQLQERLERAERERDAARAALTQFEDAQKK
jgi:chromosome segregation ATPase